LAGDDDFRFKVSPDGSAWREAIVINRSTGVVTFPFTTFAGMVWRGTWVTSTAYAVANVVRNNGSSYVCVQAHTSGSDHDEPGSGANTATYWDLLAA
ncbi:MAG: carbohydrate-binding protein, partial [Hyphomicrobium sp.]